MSNTTRTNTWLIDLAGAFMCASCMAGIIWLTLLRDDVAGRQLRGTAIAIQAARRELAEIHQSTTIQNNLLAAREKKLDESGRLPSETPVELCFQTLIELASDHHLTVLRHYPRSSREYPGLMERRYAFVVSGGLRELLGFLHAVEATDLWVDVSYLKLARGSSRVPGERTAELTVSLFSALELKPAVEEG